MAFRTRSFVLLLSCWAPGCFDEAPPVDDESADGAGTEADEDDDAAPDDDDDDDETAGPDDDDDDDDDDDGTTGAGDDDDDDDDDDTGGTGGAEVCACGLDPGLGLWCSPETVPVGEAQTCPAAIADAHGESCDTLDPPLTEEGCCLGDGTIAFCFDDEIVVDQCDSGAFEGCAAA